MQILETIEDVDWVVTTINKLARESGFKLKFLRLFAYYSNPKEVMQQARKLLSNSILYPTDEAKFALIQSLFQQNTAKNSKIVPPMYT